MKLYQYDDFELLQMAQMAFWLDDYKFANTVIREVATRVTEEHPPDGPRYGTGSKLPEIDYGKEMEAPVAEGAEKARPETSRGAAYDDRFCFEQGSN